MPVKPLIKNAKYIGTATTAALSIPAGVNYVKFWVNINDVVANTGTARMWLEHSLDGSSWTVLTTIEVESPPSNNAKNLGFFDGNYYQKEGSFRLRYDFPGTVTLDASYEVF